MDNEEIEEFSIDLNIFIQKLKEKNECANSNDDEMELADYNLYYLEKIEELMKDLKF
jgi:hypothetical protein